MLSFLKTEIDTFSEASCCEWIVRNVVQYNCDTMKLFFVLYMLPRSNMSK
jgi:hypothetical protein